MTLGKLWQTQLVSNTTHWHLVTLSYLADDRVLVGHSIHDSMFTYVCENIAYMAEMRTVWFIILCVMNVHKILSRLLKSVHAFRHWRAFRQADSLTRLLITCDKCSFSRLENTCYLTRQTLTMQISRNCNFYEMDQAHATRSHIFGKWQNSDQSIYRKLHVLICVDDLLFDARKPISSRRETTIDGRSE